MSGCLGNIPIPDFSDCSTEQIRLEQELSSYKFIIKGGKKVCLKNGKYYGKIVNIEKNGTKLTVFRRSPNKYIDKTEHVFDFIIRK